MAAQSNAAATAESSDRVLVITRIFDAPPALVFKAWIDAEHVAKWQGPRGFSTTAVFSDLRPGGSYRLHMLGPDGDHWMQGTWREIREPERLVFTSCWADADGNAKGPETVLTLTFEQHGAGTRFTLHQAGFESVTARDMHHGGWSSALDRLGEYVAAIR